jgi:hypothetical protein
VHARHAHRPTGRARSRASLAAVLLGLVLSALLIWQTSYSAYSATTSNATDSWSTGDLALTDDDGGDGVVSGTAMFSATNLRPGSSGTHCITVSSTGSLPALVRLYGTDPFTVNGLSSYVDLTITQGTGGSFGSCAGFSAFAGAAGDVYRGTVAGLPAGYDAGLSDWSTNGTTGTPETRSYQFAYTIDPNAPTSTMNGAASIGLTWEAQPRTA